MNTNLFIRKNSLQPSIPPKEYSKEQGILKESEEEHILKNDKLRRNLTSLREKKKHGL